MATYTWPAGRVWTPRSMTWSLRANRVVSTSPLNGATQTVALPGSRWLVSMQFPAQRGDERQALQALLLKVLGTGDLISLSDLARPRPRGTIALSGVTASAAAQFATSVTLNGCGASTTLLAGDKFSIGNQLLIAAETATASAGGVMTVTVRPMLRAAVAGGAAVVTSAPVALFRLAADEIGNDAQPDDFAAPLAFDLEEVFT